VYSLPGNGPFGILVLDTCAVGFINAIQENLPFCTIPFMNLIVIIDLVELMVSEFFTDQSQSTVVWHV